MTEELFCHDDAERDDLVRPAQQDGGRGLAGEQELENHLAARARAAPIRDCEHLASDTLATQRVVPVDHGARDRVDASPEAEADAGAEKLADATARHDGLADDGQGG